MDKVELLKNGNNSVFKLITLLVFLVIHGCTKTPTENEKLISEFKKRSEELKKIEKRASKSRAYFDCFEKAKDADQMEKCGVDRNE
ncbi:MAG: hypothetical protein ACOYL6_15415 [Bacteriovoracaceae bacterium]